MLHQYASRTKETSFSNIIAYLTYALQVPAQTKWKYGYYSSPHGLEKPRVSGGKRGSLFDYDSPYIMFKVSECNYLGRGYGC